MKCFVCNRTMVPVKIEDKGFYTLSEVECPICKRKSTETIVKRIWTKGNYK